MTAIARLRLDWQALTRLAIGVVLIVLIVAGPSAYGSLTAGGRVDPGLEAVNGPVNVRVHLAFQPQSYHQATLSQYGVFGGIRGHTVILYNVSQDALHQLGDFYWIDHIHPFRRS